jgi:hypothetical protein
MKNFPMICDCREHALLISFRTLCSCFENVVSIFQSGHSHFVIILKAVNNVSVIVGSSPMLALLVY